MPVPTVRSLRRSAAAACALAGALLLGCAPGAPTGIPTAPLVRPVQTSPDLAAGVPPSIAADGFLRVGTDPSYKPMEYFDSGGRLTGLEIQLVQAVAAKLGLRPRFIPEAFTAIEAGVRAQRFDLGAAALSLTPGEALTTDAVLYLASGIRLARQKGSDLVLTDLCGHRVAALEGSRQLSVLRAASVRCTDRGAEPVTVLAFLSQTDVTRSVLTRGAEGMVADAPVAQSAAQSYPAELELAPGEVEASPFAVLAGDDVAAVVAEAIDELIADGTYDQILAAFGVTQGAVEQAAVLPAGEPLPPDMIAARQTPAP